MKIVRESKSEFRIPPRVQVQVQNTPQNENCQRVQVRVQNTSTQNENCQSPSLSSEYPPTPKMEIVRESKSKFRIPPQNENCQRVQVRVQNIPQSPSPSSEYPPK